MQSRHRVPQVVAIRLSFVLILTLSASPVHSEATTGWTKITVADIVMFTDLTPAQGSELAHHLLRFRHAIGDFPFPSSFADRTTSNQATPKLELLVFAKRRDFARLMRSPHFAAFTQPGLRRTLLVIGPANIPDGLWRNLRHEYVHYHLRNHSTGFPVWFDEGLAVMLEHLEFNPGDTTARLDTKELFDRYPERVQARRGPSLADMLATERVDAWPARYLPRFYGLMGQLVHFLYFGHEVGHTNLRDALRTYLAGRSNKLTNILGVSEDTLARQLDRYKQRRQPRLVLPLVTNSPTEPTTTIAMTAVERDQVHARAAENANPQRAISLYQKIAKAQSTNPDAFVDLSRAQLSQGDSEAAATSLAIAEDLLDAPNAHFLLQQAVQIINQCELDDLAHCQTLWRQASGGIREALDLDPDRIDGIYLQGVIELYRGRPGSAANYLKAAHRIAPWSPRVNYHLGECLRLLGDPAAQFYLENTLAWSRSEAWRTIAQASLAKLSG